MPLRRSLWLHPCMNWKAEFSKAGELALTSGTLILLGGGLFALGRGRGFTSESGSVYLDLVGDPVGWGVMAAFLTALFLGCFRRNTACAGTAAFILCFVGAGIIGGGWGGFFLDGLSYISIGDLTTETYIGLLIWVLGLLLLSLRFSRTILAPCTYVLFSV